MNRTPGVLAARAMLLGVSVSAVHAQAGRDACLERLRKEGGPDAQNGIDLLGTMWSQAGTQVTVRDAGGTVWECVGYDDGATGYLEVTHAAGDGAGAMERNPASEGPENDGETTAEIVQFAKGTYGADFEDSLTRRGAEADRRTLCHPEGQSGPSRRTVGACRPTCVAPHVRQDPFR